MSDTKQNKSQSFAMLSAMLKGGLKLKPKLSAIDYARRFAREKTRQQRRYCDAFELWRTCLQRACQRVGHCGGNADACLRRALDRVPHPLQWRARRDILDATPPNIGAPERAARQCMPRDCMKNRNPDGVASPSRRMHHRRNSLPRRQSPPPSGSDFPCTTSSFAAAPSSTAPARRRFPATSRSTAAASPRSAASRPRQARDRRVRPDGHARLGRRAHPLRRPGDVGSAS